MEKHALLRPAILCTMLLLGSCAAERSVPLGTDTIYPQRELRRGDIRMQVYLPDAASGFYRGPRFDASGLIARVTYRDHTFFGPFKPSHDPLRHDDILGPAEEFGMESPLGYAEASPGESFLKIGVGELRRIDDTDYRFHEQYDVVKPLTWTITGDDRTLTFATSQPSVNGYAYEYSKQIRLHSDGFSITRHLRSTGSKTIDTDHYSHNFIIIDDVPAGPAYTVEYSFPVSTKTPQRNVSPAVLIGQTISFSEPLPPGKAVWMELDGWESAADATATVRLLPAGAAVRITGEVDPTKLVFYATSRAICPETFIPIYIEPRSHFTWTTHYQFMVSDSPGAGARAR